MNLPHYPPVDPDEACGHRRANAAGRVVALGLLLLVAPLTETHDGHE